MSFARRTRQKAAPVSSRRGRATAMPRAERHAQLLAVARGIIQAEGVAALTMSALSERAEVSKPVVYEHFENREAVAAEVVRDYFDEYALFVLARVEVTDNVFDYLDASIEASFEFRSKNRLALRKITNGFSSSALINAAYLEAHQRALRVYRSILEQQGVPKATAAGAAYALKEMINSVILEFAGGRNAGRTQETLKLMVRAAVGVLAPGPGPKPVTPPLGVRSRRAMHRAPS